MKALSFISDHLSTSDEISYRPFILEDADFPEVTPLKGLVLEKKDSILKLILST